MVSHLIQWFSKILQPETTVQSKILFTDRCMNIFILKATYYYLFLNMSEQCVGNTKHEEEPPAQAPSQMQQGFSEWSVSSTF